MAWAIISRSSALLSLSSHSFHADFEHGDAFMEKRLCAACRQLFRPRPQCPRQTFCRSRACQRQRRQRWQEAKLRADPDYRENQRSAQQAWCARNPDYWSEYRRTHPEYRERNKAQQRARRRDQSGVAVAKMDASKLAGSLKPGLYRIVPTPGKGVGKMGAWTAEITWISGLSGPPCARCKERTR